MAEKVEVTFKTWGFRLSLLHGKDLTLVGESLSRTWVSPPLFAEDCLQ